MKLSEAKCPSHSQIKNIILDWGGVITDIHFRLCTEAFGKMGLRFDWAAVGTTGDNIFTPYETGSISTEEFIKRLKGLIPMPASDQELINAWNLVLGDLPAERWEILEKLKGRYRMFLLSNTNALHVEYYTGYLKRKYGTNGYFHLFERAYFSHEIGMRKPDADIFDYVIKNENLIPSETLFVDDFEENISTAASAGLQVYHLRHPETLKDLFI